jgi:hypothetical protein
MVSGSLSCYQFVMSWIRDGSFPLIPSGREINFRLLSDDGQHIWITVKGENAHATEQLAESILRSLNPPPDLITDDVEGHTPKVEAT